MASDVEGLTVRSAWRTRQWSAEASLDWLRSVSGTSADGVDAILADPKIYDGAPERVISLGKDKARFEAEIAKVEDRWLELSTELEEAEQA